MMRTDLALIARWITPGWRVLDLGCGDGLLLKTLETSRGCHIQGVEIDPELHLAAVTRGVPVLQLDIDRDLDLLGDQTFDVVVLSRTLQAVHYPAAVLRAMLRLAPRAIVSMPNFAYWRNRWRLVAGRAPVSKDLPYQWYESPNVHFGSLRDLEALFAALDLTVARRLPLAASGRVSRAPERWRNWQAGAALYALRQR